MRATWNEGRPDQRALLYTAAEGQRPVLALRRPAWENQNVLAMACRITSLMGGSAKNGVKKRIMTIAPNTGLDNVRVETPVGNNNPPMSALAIWSARPFIAKTPSYYFLA